MLSRSLRFSLLLLLLPVCLVGSQAAKKPAAAPQKTSQPRAQTREMKAQKLAAALKVGRRILILDVRPLAEFDAGHAEDAINVPFPTFHSRVKELQIPKSAEVVTMDGPGGRAAQAANELLRMGYTKAAYASFPGWKAAGLTVQKTPPSSRKR
jgi:rhodanese-related sulfurtransferase